MLNAHGPFYVLAIANEIHTSVPAKSGTQPDWATSAPRSFDWVCACDIGADDDHDEKLLSLGKRMQYPRGVNRSLHGQLRRSPDSKSQKCRTESAAARGITRVHSTGRSWTIGTDLMRNEA